VPILRRILWPFLASAILLYLAYGWDGRLETHGAGSAGAMLRLAILAGLWLAGAWLLNEFIRITTWERAKRPVPALLKHILSILIFGLAITGILSFVFGQSVAGIWATSGVVGLVLGFATRSLIADLFSGIALHLDPPFRIGDWIEWKDGNDRMHARVQQINWRSTRVFVRDDTKVIFIPNSMLASVAVANVYMPQECTRQVVRVPLDPAVSLDRAQRVLLAGLLAAEGPLAHPTPEVLIDAIHQDGLIFLLRYWHVPENSIAEVKSSVLHSVLSSLEHAGIKTARNRHDVQWGEMPSERSAPKDARWNLRRLEVFSAFDDHEIDAIAASALRLELKAGETVVQQDQPGDSLFFVMEGLLDVMIGQPGKQAVRVSRLQQGQYFGEMSLLTGDPRSATIIASTGVVLYEVAKKVLEPILAARPEVLHQLAKTVANRQLQNQVSLAKGTGNSLESEQQTFATQILGKIRSFFSTP
jgi:small-conductance mechanosensitive channel/CRP-like cAMP-binding protein